MASPPREAFPVGEVRNQVTIGAMSVIDWLLDTDPAIRWQVRRDLMDADAEAVVEERRVVSSEGWGALLLSEQAEDGTWDGGTYRPGWVDEERPFFDAWTATHFALQDLRSFGVDPNDPAVVQAVAGVRDNVRWEATGEPYFAGETEPCINGSALAVGAWFRQDVDCIVEKVLSQRLSDGGWNCWAEFGARVSSYHTTLCVLEGLLGWEQAGGTSGDVTEARRSGEEYLLERRLFHRLTDGSVADPRFTMFSFPTRWYYDVLRALDYFCRAGSERDPRMAEAFDLVESKRDSTGRWPLENIHQGATLFEMEGPEGFPSRWNTLRAMRVLRWWHGD